MVRLRNLFLIVLTVALAAATRPVGVAADTSPSPTPTAAAGDQYAQQLQQQLQEQQAINATKASLQAEIGDAQTQQAALASLIIANQQAVQTTLTKLAAAEQRLSQAKADEATYHANALAALAEERKDKAILAAYLVQRYTTQDNFTSYIFSSASLDQMFSRAADVGHVIDRGEQLTNQVTTDAEEAQRAEDGATRAANAAQKAASDLQQQQQTLQDENTNAQSLISQLSTQSQAAAQEIAQADQQSAALAQQIAQTQIAQMDALIAQAYQADWQAAEYWIQQNLGSLPSGFTTTSTTQGSAQFAWPAPGSYNISQPYGPSQYTFEPPYDGYPHFHTGLDLPNAAGSPIVAAEPGVVVAAGFDETGYGNHIIIAHAGGFLTLYGHLETMLVTPGQTVSEGQLIGLMGSTGNSTGSHLHFEIRFNNQPIDPSPLLPANPQDASSPSPSPTP